MKGKEEIYGWPPFYTLQPVRKTQEKQLDLWVERVLQKSRMESPFYLYVDPHSTSFACFEVDSLDRQVSIPLRRKIIEELVDRKVAKYISDDRAGIEVFPYPKDEIIVSLVQYVNNSQLFNVVLTVFECFFDEKVKQEIFYGLHEGFIKEILMQLKDTNQLLIFNPSHPFHEWGLKFLPPSSSSHLH